MNAPSVSRVQCLRRQVLDLGVTSRASMSEMIRIASEARRGNVYGIWIGEDIAFSRDVFVQASVLMRNAPNRIVGIALTSPAVHNITTIARAAASLRQIDRGWFRLSLGVGGLQDLARLRVTVAKSVAMMKQAMDALRKIWTGGTVTVQGETFELRRFQARYRSGLEIPIYLGVRGPKLLRLAGRTADGIILSGPLPYLQQAIDLIRAEATSRDSRARFRIVVWLPTLVVKAKKDRDLARSVAATVIADTPPNVLEMARIPEDDVGSLRRTARQQGYTEASKYVTDELLESFTLAGDTAHICEAFLSLGRLGVDEVIFGPPYGRDRLHSIREVIRAWARL